jgi:hypothetical protein
MQHDAIQCKTSVTEGCCHLVLWFEPLQSEVPPQRSWFFRLFGTNSNKRMNNQNESIYLSIYRSIYQSIKINPARAPKAFAILRGNAKTRETNKQTNTLTHSLTHSVSRYHPHKVNYKITDRSKAFYFVVALMQFKRRSGDPFSILLQYSTIIEVKLLCLFV